MGKTYVVSDTHFTSLRGCNSALRKNYINQVADVWNMMVNPQDTVIHLGDVAWSRHGLGYLAPLNGKKILVLGNHDSLTYTDYTPYFTAVYEYYHIHDILFSHAPLCPHWKAKHQVGNMDRDISYILKGGTFRTHTGDIRIEKIKYNIHGHFHHVGTTQFEEKSTYYHEQTPYTMFCVYNTPIPLENIV